MKNSDHTSFSFGKENNEDQIEEAQLWEQLQNGSLLALEEIYKSYHKKLFQYGYKLSADKDIAEDCVQELFVKIWKSKEKLAAVKSVKAYLFKSYRSIWLDHIKDSNRKTGLTDLPQNYDIEFSAEEIIINEQSSSELSQKLNVLLNNLTKKQKEVIYLRFYKNLNYEEIAEIMQVNNQTVRNCVHEALKVMRGQFDCIIMLILFFLDIIESI